MLFLTIALSLLVVASSVNKGRSAFKFENMWLKEEGFVEGSAMVEWVLLCGFSKLYSESKIKSSKRRFEEVE